MTKTVSTKSTIVTSATTTVLRTITNIIILRFVIQIANMTWTFEMAPVIMMTKTTNIIY